MHVLSERVTSSWQFESPLWGIASGIPLASHFDWLVLSLHWAYLRILRVQARTAQPRWIPAKRPMGGFGITPLLTFKELFSACVVGEVSWLRE